MKRILIILLIPLISIIQGCLSPVMYDDNGYYSGGVAQAKVSVDGFSMYGYETGFYSATYGTQHTSYNIYMMDKWETTFDVYAGDKVFLEVEAGSSGVEIAIDLYQDYTRFKSYHIYVPSYETDAISVEILAHP